MGLREILSTVAAVMFASEEVEVGFAQVAFVN